MPDKTIDTIAYYNDKSTQYAQDTQHVDFTEFQNIFMSYLQPNALIVDLGCGAGRDSKAFLEKCFRIIAVDGSSALASIAEEYIGQEVICDTFQHYTPAANVYGIWACASLLHLPEDEIKDVITRLTKKLNPGGVFYMSFKHGDFAGFRNERFFTDLTNSRFKELIKDIPDIEIVYEKISTDVRAGRENEQWLNVILKRME
jgi:trans-aconitate methyltransferase